MGTLTKSHTGDSVMSIFLKQEVIMEKLQFSIGDRVKLKNQAIFGSYMGKTSDKNKIWFLDMETGRLKKMPISKVEVSK